MQTADEGRRGALKVPKLRNLPFETAIIERHKLDGIALKRSWGGEIYNVSVLVAIGVASDGFRQVLGV